MQNFIIFYFEEKIVESKKEICIWNTWGVHKVGICICMYMCWACNRKVFLYMDKMEMTSFIYSLILYSIIKKWNFSLKSYEYFFTIYLSQFGLQIMLQVWGTVTQGYYYKDEQSMIIWKIGSAPFGCTPTLLKSNALGQLLTQSLQLGSRIPQLICLHYQKYCMNVHPYIVSLLLLLNHWN